MSERVKQVVSCTNVWIARNRTEKCLEAIVYPAKIEKGISKTKNGGKPCVLKKRKCTRVQQYKFKNVHYKELAGELPFMCDEEEVPEPEREESGLFLKEIDTASQYYIFTFGEEVKQKQVLNVFDALCEIYQRVE